MIVYESGCKTPVSLEQKDFVFSGGEGKVFIKGDTAYKIYHDQTKVIESARMTELQEISSPYVIKPIAMLIDEKNKPVGYTMKALHNTMPLSRLFTNEFRLQNNISDNIIHSLLQKMRDTIASLHSKDILIVDGNEMNYLVSEDFKDVYFIDVDSYQTKSFPAKAYSESTLDPKVDLHKKNFSPDSDWFGFGIIVCQMLLGIHPFKGTYKGSSHTFKRGDIPSRMKEHISIFNAKVSVNSAVRDFSVIPGNYQQWLESMFEHGNRLPAPINMTKTTIAAFVATSCQSNVINISDFFTSEEQVVGIYSYQQNIAWKTKSSFVIKDQHISYRDKDTHLVFTPRSLTPLLIKVENGDLLVLNTATKEIIKERFDLKRCFVYQNRAYGVAGGYIHEFEFMETAKGIVIVSNASEAIMPLSTECFDNALIQHMLGATYFTLPFAPGAMAQIRIKELENKRIINAKFENGLLGVIWNENGSYKRALIKFNTSYNAYNIFQITDTDDLSINFTVLDNGIAIDIPQDGVLQVFDVRIDKADIKTITDDQMKGQFSLCHHGVSLIAINNNKGFKLSLSKS